MVTDPLELPEGSLKSVDALVARADGPDCLVQTIHICMEGGFHNATEE